MAEEAEDLPKIHNRTYPGGNNVPPRSGMQLVLGYNNRVCADAVGVLVTGSDNVVGCGAQNITLTNSSGCIVAGGLRNITIINSSGVTVTEDNTIVENGVITLSPSSGVVENKTYKTYVALITQVTTSNPTVKIIENTIGNIIWTRIEIGVYRGTLAGAFPNVNKVFFTATQTIMAFSLVGLYTSAGGNFITLETVDYLGNFIDSALENTSISVRVYN